MPSRRIFIALVRGFLVTVVVPGGPRPQSETKRSDSLPYLKVHPVPFHVAREDVVRRAMVAPARLEQARRGHPLPPKLSR